MTLDEFLIKICEHGIGWSSYQVDPKSTYRAKQWLSREPRRNKTTGEFDVKLTADDYLYVEWVTGGVSGGSCWDEGDSDSHYPTSGEKEPEFTALDSLLTAMCPAISFLQYKTLVAAVVKYSERTEYEYYGNSTNYGIKTVRLGDLYVQLQPLIKS